MNKSIKKLTMFVIAIIMIGCGKSNDKWITANAKSLSDHSSSSNKHKYVKNYTLNQRRTIYIGEEIIKIKLIYYDTFAHAEVTVPSKIDVNYTSVAEKEPHIKMCELEAGKYPIEKKLLFDEENTIADSGKTFYLVPCIVKGDKVPSYNFLVDNDGNISDKAMYAYYYKMLWLPTKINISSNKVLFSGELASANISGEGSVHYELVYTGKNDMSMNVAYREYTAGDLARPNFFQNLTYEATAKQIRFKKFIIQINEATNEKLDYTIIEDGLVDEI